MTHPRIPLSDQQARRVKAAILADDELRELFVSFDHDGDEGEKIRHFLSHAQEGAADSPKLARLTEHARRVRLNIDNGAPRPSEADPFAAMAARLPSDPVAEAEAHSTPLPPAPGGDLTITDTRYDDLRIGLMPTTPEQATDENYDPTGAGR